MKNMHEDKFIEELNNRMRGINNVPDDLVWKNLNARLQKDRSKTFWLNFVGKAVFLVALLTIIVVIERNDLYSHIDQEPNPELASSNQNVPEQKSNSVKTIVPPDSIHLGNARHGNNKLQFQRDAAVTENRRSSEHNQRNENDRPVDSRSYRTPDFHFAVKKFPLPVLTMPHNIPPLIKNTPRKETKVRQNKKSLIKGTSAYLHVTPVMNYLIVDPVEDDDVEVTALEPLGLFSPKRLGYSVEAGLIRNLNNHWSISTGFSYYQQNMDVQYFYKLLGQFQINPISGSEVELIPVEVEGSKVTNYSMKNIGLDFNLFYAIRTQRLEQKVGTGLTYQHGVHNSATNSSKNSNSWYLYYNFLYRIEYTLNERMTCYFQPRYSRPLLTDEKLEGPLKLKTTRAGASFGVTFRF